MKKSLLYFFVVLITFCSCSKEESLTPDTKKAYDVTFTISGFRQTIQSRNTSDKQIEEVSVQDSLKAHINYLTFNVYDLAGGLVKSWVQNIDSANFGQMKIKLVEGNYNVVVTGMNVTNPQAIGQGNGYYDAVNQHIILYANPGMEAPDVFVDKFPLEVKEENLTSEVNLKRLTSKLELTIEDVIPNNADSIELKFNNYPYTYYLKTDEVFATVHTVGRKLGASDKGASNYSVITQVIGSSTTSDIQIICYDSAGEVIAEKTAKNVSFVPNKRTMLTGKLFDEKVVSPNINIDTNWSDDKIEIGF